MGGGEFNFEEQPSTARIELPGRVNIELPIGCRPGVPSKKLEG
jgi:hypothetical protein